MTIGNGNLADATDILVEHNADGTHKNVHRKQFSDATERTSSTGGWNSTATAFALSAPVGALVTNMVVTLDIKNPTAEITEARMLATGTNLGSVIISSINRTTDTSYLDTT